MVKIFTNLATVLVKVRSKGNSHILLVRCASWLNYFGRIPREVCPPPKKKKKASTHIPGDYTQDYSQPNPK